MKRVLVIAYYFPPMGLSGVQRIARFVKYLPETGWAPTVLTVEPAGYFAFDEALLAELHRPEINIVRVASIDPTRFFGKKSTVSLPAEGSRRWNEVHGHLGLKVPGLTGYVQNFCVGTLEGIDSIDDAGVSDGRPPFDGYACEWHESNDAFQEGLRSPEWKKVTEDGKSLWAKSSLEHMCAAIEQRTMRDGPHSAFKVAIFFSAGDPS